MRCRVPSAGASPWEWAPARQESDECELSITPDGEGSFLPGSVQPSSHSELSPQLCLHTMVGG